MDITAWKLRYLLHDWVLEASNDIVLYMIRKFIDSPSYGLFKTSLNFIRYNKSLILFPILSFVGIVIVVILFWGLILNEVMYQLTIQNNSFPTLSRIVTVLFFWFLIVFSFVFFKASAIRVIYGRMIEKQKTSLIYGMKIALTRIVQLIGWSILLAAGLSLLQFTFRWISKSRLAEKTTLVLIEVLGSVLWFVLPSILLEKKNVMVSIKDSTSLFRRNWGETFVIKYSAGSVFSLIYIVGLIVMFVMVGVAFSFITDDSGFDIATIVGLLFFLSYFVFVILGVFIQSVFNDIIRTALYHYASTGQIPDGFNKDLLLKSISSKELR